MNNSKENINSSKESILKSQFKKIISIFHIFRYILQCISLYNKKHKEVHYRMRRIVVYFICFFMMLSNIKQVSADTKIDSMMKNKNQDVLFVGTISHISDDYFVLSAKDYINTEATSEAIGKRTENHRYVIIRNENTKYTSSYHEKTTFEEGDHVIASLKKTDVKWVIANGLYEVDSDDYKTLSVKSCDKNPDYQSIVLKYFINSDGMMKKFSSKDNGNKVYCQGKKIYDTRWNMKKYLTIEEIRNSEKLKQMDHKTNVIKDIEEKTTFKTRRWIMFAIDLAAIIVVVGLLRNRKCKKIK